MLLDGEVFTILWADSNTKQGVEYPTKLTLFNVENADRVMSKMESLPAINTHFSFQLAGLKPEMFGLNL